MSFFSIKRAFYGAVLWLIVIAFHTALSIELQCDYSESGLIQWEMMYSCRAKGLEIRSANQTLTITSSSLQQNNSTRTNNDVKGVYFNKQITNFLPIKVSETFPNMEYFGIVDSSLHNINQGDFKGYNKLIVLDIIDNNIRFLNNGTFDGATNLVKMRISSNQIIKVARSALKGLVKLELLDLSRNRIHSLYDETFNELLSLKVLNLRRNNLKELKFGLLISNLRLEDIDLGLNMLQLVNSKMFLHLPNLKYIEFDDNFCINDYFTNDTINDMQIKLDKHCSELSETVNTALDEIQFLRADINFLENKLLKFQKQFTLLENVTNMTQLASNQTVNATQLTQELSAELESFKERFTKLQNEVNEHSHSDLRLEIIWFATAIFILCILVGGFIYYKIAKRRTNAFQHIRMGDF
ncbi:unnamed protein product [Diamesa tonsa]